MSFDWVLDAVVEAIHDEQLAAHGGLAGLRDVGLLASALAKPLNLFADGTPDVAECAAAYAVGIARNHPFLDGNKRTAFLTMLLFLAMNKANFEAPEPECVVVMQAVADGTFGDATLAEWIRAHLVA